MIRFGAAMFVQFTVDQAFNATAEVAAANNYPYLRVVTVGQSSTSYTPLTQLASIEQNWIAASNLTIGAGNWSAFSAVCWFFGRDIYNAFEGQVPIGRLQLDYLSF
jgi:sialate O-acetylesterase